MKYIIVTCLVLLLCVSLSSCASDPALPGHGDPEDEVAAPRLLYPYESSTVCKGCHAEQYQQYEDSLHFKAFTNPLFNTRYFSEVVPRAQKDAGYAAQAKKCLSCHAPVVFMNYTGLVATPAQVGRVETGVTCDFCHTLGGTNEKGDFLQVSSRKKQGPFIASGSASFHSEYSGYVQLGEFCGCCHGANNHSASGIKSTFDEWREGSPGQSRVACQECHMSKNGALVNGTAEFERGQAAHVNIGGAAKKQKEHEKLYNHAFPGASQVSQDVPRVRLVIQGAPRNGQNTGRVPFSVLLDNKRAGHKIPSGNLDLRLMWLDVTAMTDDGRKIAVTLHGENSQKIDYSVAGGAADNDAMIDNDVSPGSRLYRIVLVNGAGRQALFRDDATTVALDNRLEAAEQRTEEYSFTIPAEFSGKVTVEASLYYKGAPISYTSSKQLPLSEKVLLATSKREFIIGSPRANRN